MSLRVLVVDDDADVRSSLARALERGGSSVRTAEDAEVAVAAVSGFRPDVVLTDVRMPGMDGIDLLRLLKERAPGVDVVVMTGFNDLPVIATAMKDGAVDMLIKPIEIGHLLQVFERIEQDRSARRSEAERAAKGTDAGVDLVGRDPAMVEIFKTIGRIAASRTGVLVRGESGTGKELIARAIHMNSNAAAEPFVAVNCTALPANLLESELFGHVRGSFTGASSDRKGCFAQAGRGTVFLDEIGDTTLDFQAKLLRVLQESEFTPVGAERSEPMQARAVAATHRPLEELVAEGRFREDLYYRMRVVEIVLPPLRERPGDIPLLAQHLVEKVGRVTGVGERFLSQPALEALLAHHWPGNVRELENCLTRAVVMSGSTVIRPESLVLGATESSEASGLDTLDAAERQHVARVLTSTGGNKSRAARVLAISRPRLDRLIKKHEIVLG